jgi:threonine synthase
MSPEYGRTVNYVCTVCGAIHDEHAPIWRCGCGGLLELGEPAPFDAADIDAIEPGFWRYAAAFPAVPKQEQLRIGETMTPLYRNPSLQAWLKLDFLFPTGSYKDRGSAVLISKLASQGIGEVIEDSSGNAGSSIAAYCAAGGIACNIFVAASTSPAKLAQIRAYGARLLPIDGDRSAVATAALEASARHFYASHNWHPAFVAGVSSLGFELWEQLGYESPDSVVVPCGHGGLVLGVARAFQALELSGGIARAPRIFAVQTAAFPAVADAFARQLLSPIPMHHGHTVAEGIACRLPVRGAAVLRAIRSTGGKAISVTEDEIEQALAELLKSGTYVEPTSAVALAGLRKLSAGGDVDPGGRNVVVLTGSGLKASAAIDEIIGRTVDSVSHAWAAPEPA